jgi:hypothetical protein
MNLIGEIDVSSRLARPNGFDDIPLDLAGEPMRVAQSEREFIAYIEWLADYLFRPSAVQEASLSLAEAWSELVGIEIEIANWIWTHPFDDYPPQERLPPNGARHWDILHREALCRILSRVPDRIARISLLNGFYTELNTDASK